MTGNVTKFENSKPWRTLTIRPSMPNLIVPLVKAVSKKSIRYVACLIVTLSGSWFDDLAYFGSSAVVMIVCFAFHDRMSYDLHEWSNLVNSMASNLCGITSDASSQSKQRRLDHLQRSEELNHFVGMMHKRSSNS